MRVIDRDIVYLGQIPLEENFLFPQRAAMVGLGKLAEAVIGTDPLIDGLFVRPTAPASLAVRIDPGQIYLPAALDALPYGALDADIGHQIVKQGVMLDPKTLAVTPPGSPGYSQWYLVQVAFQEVDGGAAVLPYYNSANPSQAWAGPGNSGAQQYTRRLGSVAVQLKAGAPAPSGTQPMPNADPGWVGLAWVSVTNGQTTITASNITPYTSVPRLLAKLPQLAQAASLNYTKISQSTTLKAEQAGVVVVDVGAFTGAIDITLPKANSGPPGMPFRFNFFGRLASGTQYGFGRVKPASGDRLDCLAAGQDMYIGPWDNFILTSDGVDTWYITGSKGGMHHLAQTFQDQTIPSGVETAITFHGVSSARPWWSASDPTALNIPTVLRARVDAGVVFEPNATGVRRAAIYLNGAPPAGGFPYAAVQASPSFTGMTLCGGLQGYGGRIQLLVYQDSGLPLRVLAGYTWMNLQVTP